MKHSFLISSGFGLFMVAILASCGTVQGSHIDPKYTLQDYDASYDPSTYVIRKSAALASRPDFLHAIDVSMESLIEEQGGHYYNENGYEEDFYQLIKEHGVGAVRVRLFVDYSSPSGVHGAGKCDLPRVLKMAKRAQAAGLKFILDLHYSDAWADPNHQVVPYAWKDLNFDGVLTALSQYTQKTVKAFVDQGTPLEAIQIGNEINNGICWPFAEIDWSDEATAAEGMARLARLVKAGSEAAKAADPDLRVILHISNALENSEGTPSAGFYFFDQMKALGVPYDIMASSYYAQFTKTKLTTIASSINQLTARYEKPFLLAEYSYGFTTRTDSNVANALSPSDVKDSGYPLTIQGQTNYMVDLLEQVASGAHSLGACYWAGDWIPVPGAGWGDNTTKDSWANQALFTYEGIALPSLSVYKK
jgi:arabinogalactan endo-1,4-beta-galactosidase